MKIQPQYGPTCGFFNILFAAQYFGMDVDFNDIATFIAEQRAAGKTHLGEIFDIEILYEAAKTFILNVDINLVPYRVVKPDKDTIYILPLLGEKVLHYNTAFLDESGRVRFYTGKSKAERSFLWCKFRRHKRIPDTFDWGKYNASEAKRSKQKQKKIIKSRKKISAGYEESAALLESFFAAERERKEIVPVKAKGYMIKISRKIDKKKENFL